jgi:DeoR/GlpR family transcriptional regulator of sugar metabolism
MREKLNVSITTVNRDITALKEAYVLIREGGDKGGSHQGT